MRDAFSLFKLRLWGVALACVAFSSGDALAATINVPADYPTIQGAIDHAAPNDTIQVAAGTYAEQITINIPLKVRGAQADQNPVAGGRVGGESTISSQYAVSITSSDVEFNGFEVANFRYGVNVPGSAFVAPDYTLQNITVSYNWIHADDAWVGFNAEPGLLKNLLITHNFIDVNNVSPGGDAYALAAIGFSGSTATPTYENVEISYNRIRNLTADGWYGLFDGSDPSVYLINTCKITWNLFQNVADGANMNIGNISNGELSNNIFENCGGSIGIDTGTATGNTGRNGGRFSFWGTDYGFTRPSTNVTVSNNDFKDEVSGRGLTLGAGAIATTIPVHTNAFRISAVVGDLIRNLGVGTLDATNNWWGSAAGPTGNPGTLNGDITTDPWMTEYFDDPAKMVPPPFWPLSTTETQYPGFWPVPPETTTITYTGPLLDTDGDGTTLLSASLASGVQSCIESQTVTFYVDNVLVGTGTTDSNGNASYLATLANNNVYEIKVEFAGAGFCQPSSYTDEVTVALSGYTAYGGGWYIPTDQAEKANFGISALRKLNKKTQAYVVSGELLWKFDKAYRLKSTKVTQIGYVTKTGYTKCAAVGGTAELTAWDVATSTWLNPQTVTFVATGCDGGQGRKGGKTYDKPDAFGLSIANMTIPGESEIVRLSGGSIKVN
jgi:hypothetical protein